MLKFTTSFTWYANVTKIEVCKDEPTFWRHGDKLFSCCALCTCTFLFNNQFMHSFYCLYDSYQDSYRYHCAFWHLLVLLFFSFFFLMGHTSVFEFPLSASCSKSTLTPVTTTWPRQRSRTNSCRRRRRQRRQRSQATTSPPRRTCPKGNLLWWPANWQADADATSAAYNPTPFSPSQSVTSPLPWPCTATCPPPFRPFPVDWLLPSSPVRFSFPQNMSWLPPVLVFVLTSQPAQVLLRFPAPLFHLYLNVRYIGRKSTWVWVR